MISSNHTGRVQCTPNQEVAIHPLSARTHWPIRSREKSAHYQIRLNDKSSTIFITSALI